MDKEKKVIFRYCIVPKCTNTSVKTPNKLFITLPKDTARRKSWQKAMRRDIFLGEKTTKYVCEDHFNLEEDMENYLHYKLMGKGNVNIKLKPGVVPHIFHCQTDNTTERPSCSRAAYEKRRRNEYVNEAILSSQKKTRLNNPREPKYHEEISTDERVVSATEDKGIQVNIKSAKISKFTQCNFRHKNVPKRKILVDLRGNSSSSTNSSEESIYNSSTTDSSSNPEVVIKGTWNAKENIEMRAVYVIEQNPKLYLGIPSESFFLIDLISKNCHLSRIEIFITLKKIKLDYPYTILADDFGIPSTTVCHILQKAAPKLSSYFQNFVQWKSLKETQNHLPIPFRSRFRKVQSIIDCFEISIQKPSDPILQSLTWSEYKKSNTMKYLISCTPDGLISYVSNGFGGRSTDKVIVEEYNFLSLLDGGAHLMADRGFKHLDEVLLQQNNVLVRPPSVSIKKKSTKEEVKYAKRVASLRIHVERVISRIREFRLLGPHACVNSNLVKYLDDFVIIACGIINIQDYLVK